MQAKSFSLGAQEYLLEANFQELLRQICLWAAA